MDPIKREEIRGLFTLSLLALLIVIRTEWLKINLQAKITIGVIEWNFLESVDTLIFCWIIYAFMMIFSFSDDIIPREDVREKLGQIGLIFLMVGPLGIAFVVFIGLFVSYIFNFFPYSILLLIAFVALYVLSRKYEFSVVMEPKKKET